MIFYAMRRANPFRGVVQVLEIGEARALSVDALNWELQVKVERPVGWGSLNLGRTEILYSRYGVWSASDGLASFPVHPTLERQRVHRAAEHLVEALAADAESREPFRLSDRFEQWLLDGATGQPLALLATATEAPARHVPLHWRSAPNDEPGFGRERREAIERLVARRGAKSAWFERQADGSGMKVGASDTPLSLSTFPELLLSDQWPEASDAALVAEYFDWLAPRLLMLPLSHATREKLERAAAAQAGDVAHFFRLYPVIADEKLMNALRVQARLVQAD